MGLKSLIDEGEITDFELMVMVELDVFVEKFGEDWTYGNLYGHENTTPEWDKIFSNWHERGLI